MAFSIRKIFSNMNYFKKGEEDEAGGKKRRHTTSSSSGEPCSSSTEVPEPDSTSKACAMSLNLPESIKTFAVKKGSLSDTDLLSINLKTPCKKNIKHKTKKLRLDIKRANKSMSEANVSTQGFQGFENLNVENTPKHILLGCTSSDAFSQRMKEFDFNKSFDIFDAMSEGCPRTPCEENFNIESVSEQSDSDLSIISDKKETSPIKMCRKVEDLHNSSTSIEYETIDTRILRSTTPESFGDVELEKTEEDRITLLLSYQTKLEKMDCFLKNLLTEFQFHIEVSKIFHSRTASMPATDAANHPKILSEITCLDNVSRGVSPTGSWNIILDKEDALTRFKLKKQLLSMRHTIDDFITMYLQNQNTGHTQDDLEVTMKPKKYQQRHSIAYDEHKGTRPTKMHLRVNKKKKTKRVNDYPDLKEALTNLFALDCDQTYTDLNVYIEKSVALISNDENENAKCTCKCRYHCSPSAADSGLTTKDEDSSSQSITSSIGNFSLDNSSLTAYSESLDQFSYNSFQDTTISSLLVKSSMERIKFYVQAHSIQLKKEDSIQDYESKNKVTFFCPACQLSESDEHNLLKHILSQKHCEKIHFLYKTAYIKKCFAAGKEIQPSTVLNPMTMYRDDNKIVCFGDAMYACSLCFENLIVGESVLMGHCSEPDHIERRDMLADLAE